MKMQINVGTHWQKEFKQIDLLPNIAIIKSYVFSISLDWLCWYVELMFYKEEYDSINEANSPIPNN